MVHTRINNADTLMSGARYTDGFHLAVALAGPPRRALFIGAGGAIGPRQFAAFYPDAEVDIVEVDARILCAARQFFGLTDDRRLHAHVGDGRSFIAAAPDASFDIVVVDAYAGAGYLVQSLASEEFFRVVRGKLRLGGVLCANLVGGAGHPDSAVRRVASAIDFAFNGECRVFSVPGGPDNCIAVAVRGPPAHRWDDLIRRLRTVDRRVRFATAIARRPLSSTCD
jgi:spermidine synthase